MAYEKRPGYGALFINKERKQDKHPAMEGYLVLEDGREIEIAAWAKKGERAGKWLSLKISETREEQPAGEPQDDIPF